MMDCNWMVKVAISHRAALLSYGWSRCDVDNLSLREVQKELTKLGYNFKADPVLKNAPSAP